MNPKLKMLCELYDRSDESVDVNALFKLCFLNEKWYNVLCLCSHRQQVKFAYLCAKSVIHLNKNELEEEVKKPMELIEKWLENPNSISYDELTNCPIFYKCLEKYYLAGSVNVIVETILRSKENSHYYSGIIPIIDYSGDKNQEYKCIGILVKMLREEYEFQT